jgi:glycosyltransferase involved in cell wall biosynthesis
MHTFLDKLIPKQKFDYIHADQLSMAQYALAARKTFANIKKINLVLDQHNAVFTIPRRMAENSQNPLLRSFMQLESERLRLYEINACRQFDQVVWVAKHDYQAVFDNNISQLTSKTEKDTPSSTIIPICVDPYSVEPKPKIPDDPHILFIGGMHWPPNLEGVRWFIKEVFPLIRQHVPRARFTIVGKLPTRDIFNAGGVDAPGFVEDLNPYYNQARLFVVPSYRGEVCE